MSLRLSVAVNFYLNSIKSDKLIWKMTNQIRWADIVSKKELAVNTKNIKELGFHVDKRTFMVKKTVTNRIDKDFQNEVKYLTRINHENIVKLCSAMKSTAGHGLIIEEYADCGTVYNFLYDNGISTYEYMSSSLNLSRMLQSALGKKHQYISHSCMLSWMLQCAKGVAYLHEMSPKIYHNDLKTRHLLLTNNFQTLKICDFSTATEFDTSNTNKSYFKNLYAEKLDIYNFGIVLWETFIARNNNHRALDVENCEIIDSLVKLCCENDPNNRPKIRVLINLLDLLYQQVTQVKVTHELNWKDITIEKRPIGSGSFGDVFKALWKTKDINKQIAVKIIRAIDESSIDVEREVRYMSLVNHENIVRLFGVNQDDAGKTNVAMEYADCGSLYSFLHGRPRDDQKISVSIVGKLNWMLQCAKAVAYLHKLNPKILHRDLKSQNLLLFNNNQILKICDFGTVRPLASLMTEAIGTVAYMAPEVGQGGVYTEKCDVYSFGILCWEILSQRKPFYHVENGEWLAILNRVTKNDRPPMADVEINESTKPISAWIQQCWDKEARERPTFDEMVMRLEIDPLSYNDYKFRSLPAITHQDFTKISLLL